MTSKCLKLCSETTRLWLVVLLEFWTFWCHFHGHQDFRHHLLCIKVNHLFFPYVSEKFSSTLPLCRSSFWRETRKTRVNATEPRKTKGAKQRKRFTGSYTKVHVNLIACITIPTVMQPWGLLALETLGPLSVRGTFEKQTQNFMCIPRCLLYR